MRTRRLFIAAIVFLLVHIQGSLPSSSRDSDITPRFNLAESGPEETSIFLIPGDSWVDIESFDGRGDAPAISLSDWTQLVFEMSNAVVDRGSWPGIFEIARRAREITTHGTIPIAIANFRYQSIRAEIVKKGEISLQDGRLVPTVDDATVESTAFASVPQKEYTHGGNSVRFLLDEGPYITNDHREPVNIAIDFDDGSGFRTIRFGEEQVVGYTSTGRKAIAARLTLDDGTVLRSSSYFTVEHLQTPVPDDTITVEAAIPYQGGYGAGEAYVYLSPLHGSLVNPVIVVEGFDLDNTMYWDELYHLLNQENLIESLRNDGYDAVVLNFTDATDHMQRNAYVLVELVQQVLSRIPAHHDIAVVGASMGGLVARYALAYMEQEGIDHRTRLFISFDSPQRGANIPLGVQYWVEFFSEDSAEAAFLRDQLNSHAARQMLVYHFTVPPGSTGESDPLMDAFNADLAAVGSYPEIPRNVAIANGSGHAASQAFNAGDQLILYDYSSILVDIVGNVWAVPDGGSGMVFDGLMDLIWPLPDRDMQVSVSGTEPYDNAPGGTRASMAQMDSTEAPYGDIVALYDDHCFIPTVSALDLETSDLFYNIAGDPLIMDLTPFDAIYFPTVNEEHVTITPENAVWLLYEIKQGVTGIEEEKAPRALALHQNYPNPFNPQTRINFVMPRAGSAKLTIFDIRGARVANIFDGLLEPGPQSVSWNGRDSNGRSVATGLYLYRLEACGTELTRKMLLLR